MMMRVWALTFALLYTLSIVAEQPPLPITPLQWGQVSRQTLSLPRYTGGPISYPDETQLSGKIEGDKIAPGCPTCIPDQYKTFEAILKRYRPPVERYNDIVDFAKSTKNKQELEAYFACYKQVDPKTKKHKRVEYLLDDKLKAAFDILADNYHLPVAFLSCLSFIESRFKPTAVSRVGAVGIAQIMETTLPTINKLIENPSQKELSECLDHNLDDHLNSNIFCNLIKDRTEKFRCQDCRSLAKRIYFSKLWSETSKEFQSSPQIKTALDKTVDSKNTLDSLTGMATYLSSIIMDTDLVFNFATNPKGVNDLIQKSQSPLKLFLNAVAVGYNRGPGRIGETGMTGDINLVSSLTTDETAWTNMIALKKQSKGYFTALERCMGKYDYTAPYYPDEEINDCSPLLKK